MAYTIHPTSWNPSCILLLVDQSGSMNEVVRSDGMTKASLVAEAINQFLRELVEMCQVADFYRNWFEVAIIRYGETIDSAFQGVLTGRDFVQIDELVHSPLRWEARRVRFPDGVGGSAQISVHVPVWIEPNAGNGTPMCAALRKSLDLLSGWTRAHAQAFPPVVINITDGEPTDGDPTLLMNRLRNLATEDGNVLLFNCLLDPNVPDSVDFLSFEAIPEGYARFLFENSSRIPPILQHALLRSGVATPRGARGFGYNSNLLNFLRIFSLGTEPNFSPDVPFEGTRDDRRIQPKTSKTPLRVFLCHASEDKPTVRTLYQRLISDGFIPWLDEEDILPGQDWSREITLAVRASDIVLACFSNHSVNKSGYLQKEIKFALDVADEKPDGTIFLIPVKLEECEIPDSFRRWQSVNLFDADGYERLARALTARAGG